MTARVWDRIRGLHQDESGQDLIEYALVAALIAFAATASMSTLATDINMEFSKLGSLVTTNTTP